jgi:putative membrane protein
MFQYKMALIGMGAIALATLTGCQTPTDQSSAIDQSQSDQNSTVAQSSPSSSPTTSTSSSLSASDQQFVIEAAQGGLAEVQLGQLAARNASSPTVQEYGQRMVTDHTQANNQLQQIVSQKGMTVPTSLDERHQQVIERLSGLSGAEFDRQYMQHMVEDHAKNVAAFQNQAQQGEDSDLKAFAAQTLPTLQEHLQLARSVAEATTQSGSPSPNSQPSSP